MDSMTMWTALFYGGIGLMAAAAVGAVASFVFFHITGKRLRKQLEEEFGKKRH